MYIFQIQQVNSKEGDMCMCIVVVTSIPQAHEKLQLIWSLVSQQRYNLEITFTITPQFFLAATEDREITAFLLDKSWIQQMCLEQNSQFSSLHGEDHWQWDFIKPVEKNVPFCISCIKNMRKKISYVSWPMFTLSGNLPLTSDLID